MDDVVHDIYRATARVVVNFIRVMASTLISMPLCVYQALQPRSRMYGTEPPRSMRVQHLSPHAGLVSHAVAGALTRLLHVPCALGASSQVLTAFALPEDVEAPTVSSLEVSVRDVTSVLAPQACAASAATPATPTSSSPSSSALPLEVQTLAAAAYIADLVRLFLHVSAAWQPQSGETNEYANLLRFLLEHTTTHARFSVVDMNSITNDAGFQIVIPVWYAAFRDGAWDALWRAWTQLLAVDLSLQRGTPAAASVFATAAHALPDNTALLQAALRDARNMLQACMPSSSASVAAPGREDGASTEAAHPEHAVSLDALSPILTRSSDEALHGVHTLCSALSAHARSLLLSVTAKLAPVAGLLMSRLSSHQYILSSGYATSMTRLLSRAVTASLLPVSAAAVGARQSGSEQQGQGQLT
ncbi:MAG: hypothetical protein EOO41_04395, partial [Methanobacteriota archaeon]